MWANAHLAIRSPPRGGSEDKLLPPTSNMRVNFYSSSTDGDPIHSTQIKALEANQNDSQVRMARIHLANLPSRLGVKAIQLCAEWASAWIGRICREAEEWRISWHWQGASEWLFRLENIEMVKDSREKRLPRQSIRASSLRGIFKCSAGRNGEHENARRWMGRN